MIETVVSVTSTEKVVCVSCRTYFWDLVFLRKSQILQNEIWVSDQGLAAFIIANKPGLAAFIIANKPGLADSIIANRLALWVIFNNEYRKGSDFDHSGKIGKEILYAECIQTDGNRAFNFKDHL